MALILAGEFYAGVTGMDLAILGFLAMLPASDLAIAIVNRNVTNRWGPKCLPALSLKEGVPDSLRTLLVVPILIRARTTSPSRSRAWKFIIFPMPTRA